MHSSQNCFTLIFTGVGYGRQVKRYSSGPNYEFKNLTPLKIGDAIKGIMTILQRVLSSLCILLSLLPQNGLAKNRILKMSVENDDPMLTLF